MSKRFTLVVSLMLFVGVCMSFAQAPVISSITPSTTYPGDQLVITGSGFSATPAQLQVWFDQVKATIISSSEFSISVTVPPSARHGVVEVINLSTRLSGRSAIKFSPSFSGTTFSAALLEAPLTFAGPSELFDVCSCDLNSDGKPDLAITQFDLQTDLIVLQNQSTPGALSFNKLDKNNLASLNIGAPTEKVICADLNGDGKPELIATRSGPTKNVVYVLPNTSAGTISFGAAVSLFMDVGHFARFVRVRDLNGDGKPEIIASNSFNNQFYIYQNQSSGGVLTINPTPIKITVTGATNTYGLDVQDMDNDGKADIIINQFQSNNIFILKNTSGTSISFAPATTITVFGNINETITADINEDGKLDLISTSTLTNQVLVSLNTSTTTFSFGTTITLATSNGPWGVDAGDIDGDGDIDIIVANRNQGQVNVFLHNGNNASPSFPKADFLISNPARNVNLGDLDGDAKPDIAITTFNAGTSDFKIELLRNKNCFVPVILNEAPLAICPTQTIRLNSIPGFAIADYNWKESGAPQGNGVNPFFDITAAGNYTVTATSESGNCATTSTALTVTAGTGTLPPSPSINPVAPVCSGQNINLSTPNAGFTYSWTGPNSFTSTQQNPVITNSTNANAGEYSLVIADGDCQSNEVSVLVDIADIQSFTISSSVPGSTICQGSSLILTVSAVAGHQYQWIKDGVDISGQIGVTLTVTQEGVYKNRVQNIALGCTAETNEISVTLLAPPVASFATTTSGCVGDNITFTDQSVVDSRATPIYDWSFGDGQTASVASPTHAYASAQNFSASLTLTYTGVSGCSNNSSANINVASGVVPTITPSSVSSCPGEQITLAVAGAFTSLVWSTGESTLSITVTDPGSYSVTSVDANGCNGSFQLDIASNPLPTLVVTADRTSVALGQSAQLQASGADTYVWSPVETLSDPTIANPLATPVETTTYNVVGTITDGCSVQESIIIAVNNDPSSLDFPNVFSPNGDGINDVWIVPGIEAFSDCILSIFDKNGKRVYERKGYLNEWNGTYNGNDVPAGTYYFVLGCPDKEPFTGHLLIGR